MTAGPAMQGCKHHRINYLLGSCLAWLLVILFHGVCFSTESKLVFSHPFNTNSYNGSIAQDADGFMWVGTAEGIVRYDGYNLKRFSSGPGSISNNMAPCVFVDSAGRIWAATMGGGVNCYDKKKNKFMLFKHAPRDPFSISSDFFNWAPHTISEDNDGFIWFATQEGVNSFDPETGLFTRYQHQPDTPHSLSHNNVFTVYADRDNMIWAGTKQGGLNRLDKKTGRVTRFFLDPDNPKSTHRGTVNTIVEGDRGYLWVGTSKGGLTRLDKKTFQMRHFRHEPGRKGSLASDYVYSLLDDHRGNLWIAHSYTAPIGLELFDKDKEEFFSLGHQPGNNACLSGDKVMGFFMDRQGIIWVVENTGPVDTYDRYFQKFGTFRHDSMNKKSLGSNSVIMIHQDKRDDIWMAGGGKGGLIKFNPATNDFSSMANPIKPDPGLSSVYSIFEDDQGLFWIGAGNGTLNIFDRQSRTIEKTYKNPIVPGAAPRAILQDKFNPDILWFGTQENGLFKFDKKQGSFKQYRHEKKNPKSLSNNVAFNLFQDNEGTLWIPTKAGLNRFRRAGETFDHFEKEAGNPDSLQGNSISDCYVDSFDNFWVSTEDGGLHLFDRNREKFTAYGRKQGFTTRTIRAILEDDKGNLWLSSNAGIFVFNIKKKQVVEAYTARDGLQGTQFSLFAKSALKTKEGEMWFSGLSGVNRFDPGKILKNPYIPPVVLTSIGQAGESVVPEKSPETIRFLKLPWQKNFFEFEFSALNYTCPENNRYAYYLEGFETEWNIIESRRYGKYTNIPGGNYTLRLFGSNNDGIWNTQGTAIEIQVEHPPWKTVWAYCVYFLLLLGLWFGLWKLKTKNLEKRLTAQKKELEKERQVTDELKTIDRMKSELLEKQIHIENKLRSHKFKLEKMVKERTRQLETQKERAEAASLAKSEFLANMSHEIRTPLNLIMGFSEILQKNSRDEEIKESVLSIRSAGKSLLTLLNDILDLSKAESGNFTIEYAAFNLDDLFREIERIFSKNIEKKGLNFFINLEPGLPPVIILDKIRLRQILMNMVGNAIKFTETGSVKITVGFQNSGDNTLLSEFFFVIEDTGIGIAEDQKEFIFERFCQQKGQDFDIYGGTGIGLSISRKLVEAMEGTIEVESVVGQGSRFRVSIPDVRLPCSSDSSKPVSVPPVFQSGPAVPAERTQKKLSPEAIVKLSRLLRRMEEELKGQWELLHDGMIICEIEEFAGTAINLGMEYGNDDLNDWGEQLLTQARKFDMEVLPATLNSFPQLVKQLSDLLDQNQEKQTVPIP
ncbi:MAG: histidine kinase [Desulfobacteraceae bacterium]|nr:histidine kinase [Desulfobacteraceae bacterium]